MRDTLLSLALVACSSSAIASSLVSPRLLLPMAADTSRCQVATSYQGDYGWSISFSREVDWRSELCTLTGQVTIPRGYQIAQDLSVVLGIDADSLMLRGLRYARLLVREGNQPASSDTLLASQLEQIDAGAGVAAPTGAPLIAMRATVTAPQGNCAEDYKLRISALLKLSIADDVELDSQVKPQFLKLTPVVVEKMNCMNENLDHELVINKETIK